MGKKESVRLLFDQVGLRTGYGRKFFRSGQVYDTLYLTFENAKVISIPEKYIVFKMTFVLKAQ